MHPTPHPRLPPGRWHCGWHCWWHKGLPSRVSHRLLGGGSANDKHIYRAPALPCSSYCSEGLLAPGCPAGLAQGTFVSGFAPRQCRAAPVQAQGGAVCVHELLRLFLTLTPTQRGLIKEAIHCSRLPPSFPSRCQETSCASLWAPCCPTGWILSPFRKLHNK